MDLPQEEREFCQQTTSWFKLELIPRSSTCQPTFADSGLASIHNHVSQFLKRNFSLSLQHPQPHIYVHIPLVLSLQRTLATTRSLKEAHSRSQSGSLLLFSRNPASLSASGAVLLTHSHHLGWTVPLSTWHHSHPLRKSLLHPQKRNWELHCQTPLPCIITS